MSLFIAPVRKNYASYQHFALAALGYACLTGRVAESCLNQDSIYVDPVDGVSNVLDDLRIAEDSSCSRDCGAGCVRREEVRRLEFVDSVVDAAVGSGDNDGCSRDRASSVSEEKDESVGLSGNSLRADLAGKVVRGPNYERNKANREQKKQRKQKKRIAQGKIASPIVPVVKATVDKGLQGVDSGLKDSLDALLVTEKSKKSDLQLSLEAKWKAENELAVERARRQLAVLKANDLAAEVKRYGTNVRVATEKNMVAIEKSHEYLKATDNVPRSELDHDVHTVAGSNPGLTEGCTISPDSSASMHEFRKAQKDLLDAEARNARLEAALAKVGISLEALECKDKSEWTDTPENREILDELCPYGYGEEYQFSKVKGKFTVTPCSDFTFA